MSVRERFEDAVREVKPDWAVVLGSGLGGFVESVEVIASASFSEFANLPVSRVPGHAGRFVLASCAGVPIVIAQGRVHLYEGHSAAAVTAGVRCLSALGVRRLVLTNAAGAIHPDFIPGNWMLFTDHLNLTGTTPLSGPNFVDLTEVYSKELRASFRAAAAAEQIVLHDGIYAGLAGPQYETPAEVRMLRTFGADAVGMSTVLEAIEARALGLEVAALSCLTNHAAGMAARPLAHDEVLQTGAAAADVFGSLFRHAVRAERLA